MVWIISLLWIWSLAVAVGFIPHEEEKIKRFAIVLAVGIPVIAFVMAG
jgi:hypothetical protein